MSGYLGTKAVLLSTTSATVGGDSSVGGDSTVGGDLTVDTNTLYVDSTNNRVGIGTSSPSKSLDVNIASATLRIRDASAGNTFSVKTIAGPVSLAGSEANTAIGFMTNDTERMRIDSSGNLLMGTTTHYNSSYRMSLAPATGTGGIIFKNYSGTNTGVPYAFLNTSGGTVGSIQTNSSATSFNTSSDHRLKENVTNVTDGITRVKQLEPKRFNFIADPDTTVDGFLAHEAQTVVPEAVTGTHNEVDDDGNAVMQGIDQSKLVPLLTAALKESIAKIEALEARVTALEGN